MGISSLNFLWEMVHLSEWCPFPGMSAGSPSCIAMFVPKV